MTMVVLKDQIRAILDLADFSIEIFFVMKLSNNQRIIKRPNIADDLQNELGEEFKLYIQDSILENNGLSLIDISNADGRADVVYKYDLPDVPLQLQDMSIVMAGEDFPAFDFDHDRLENLESIIVLIGNSQHQMAVYKHQYPVSLVKRNSGINIMRFLDTSSDRFVRVDSDILKINPKFEFFRIEGYYYVVDLKVLEKFLGFKEAVKNVARQALERVRNSDLVIDVDVLAARLDDLTFGRKLARLVRNSPVLGIVPNVHIIDFVRRHPILSSKIKINEEGTKLNLKTKVSQESFLKLMNDDFLKSLLTEKDYESIAKDTIEAVPPAAE